MRQEEYDYYYTNFETDNEQTGRNVLTSSAVLQLVRETEENDTKEEQGRSLSEESQHNSIPDRVIEEKDLQEFSPDTTIKTSTSQSTTSTTTVSPFIALLIVI